MKRYLFFVIACSFLSVSLLGQTTPKSVSMLAGDNNINAFGANGQLGSNGASFYLHWDATYIYFGWDGGNTYWTGSDMYFVGIDTQNDTGASQATEGLGYASNIFDYYLVYENNCTHYGPADGCGGTQGNSFEIWKVNSSGGWSWVDRRAGNDNIQSKTTFATPGETRFRIAWTDILFTPGAGNSIAFTFWANNSTLSYVWGSWPSSNPALGTNPYVLSNKLVFSSTGSGVDPSADGSDQPLSVVLPIELISFSALKNQNNVLLNWTTASERNSSHFEVQHSTDGSLYESIARLETAGESSELQHYNLEHKTPGEGLNYYRLAHYDLDGTLSYSDVKAVDFDKNTSIKIFPNPVKNILTISPVEDFNLESIEIYDMQGVLVETLNTLGDRNDIELSTNDWKAGIYQVLLLRSDGTISVQNIIKQ